MSDGGYTGWAIGRGFVSVGPHSDVHGRNTTPGRIIWNITTPDVKEVFERFKAAGAIVAVEPYSIEMEGQPTAGSRRSRTPTATTSSSRRRTRGSSGRLALIRDGKRLRVLPARCS